MKKRLLSLMLALVLLVTVLPVSAAATTVDSGTCGDDLTWKLSDSGTLTISGEGDMYNYDDEATPWESYWKEVKKINVKSGVTSIGNRAFEFLSNAATVTLADSVTYIGTHAFSNLPIKSIDLPANLKTICWGAFQSTELTSIELPSKLETIGVMAFSGSPLEEVTIPASVTNIENDDGSPFAGIETLKAIYVDPDSQSYCAEAGVLFNKDMTELIQYLRGKSGSSYDIPSSVDVIGDDAFYGVALEEIDIPKGVKEIGKESFLYAYNLEEVELPSTVKSIGYGAFDVCYALEEFEVSGSNKYFSSKEGVLFNKDQTLLIQYPAGKDDRIYTVPGTVKEIEGSAFKGNETLFSLTIPASVESIGHFIVEACDDLQMVIFEGGAPECAYPSLAFSWDSVPVYYPVTNETWTDEVVAEFESDGDGASLFPYDPNLAIPEVTASNNYTTGKIKLTWDAVDGAGSYYIFRANSKYGNYNLIETTTKTSYTDKSNVLAAGGETVSGEKYYYRVVAVYGKGIRSLYSDPVARTCNLPRVEVTAKNTASSGKTKLSWKAVEGAVEYEVYRAAKKDGEYTKLKTTTSLSFTDSTATVGKRYYYKIVAVHENTAGNSAKSVAVARTRDLPQPVVTASNIASSGKIKLTWEAVEGAAEYEVYRYDYANREYVRIKTTSKTSYTDSNTEPGTRYCYRVKAICENTNGNSARSEKVYRTRDLAQPTISVKLNSSGYPKISWEEVDDAEKYYVYRKAKGDDSYTQIKSTTKTSCTDKTAEEGTTYYYRVVAVHDNSSANSARSDYVKVKP